MFDFLSLLIAIVALIVARKTFNQVAVLRARLDVLESGTVRPRAAVTPAAARSASASRSRPRNAVAGNRDYATAAIRRS